MTTAAEAQAALNAILLPAAQDIATALTTLQTTVATAQGIVTGISASNNRTAQLVQNVSGMAQAYLVEANACVTDLTPPATPVAA